MITMDISDVSVTRKAYNVNLDDTIYGTFAEIGAGQEVARHFFQAGRASHTIAKTISAYDMTFSDAIYGKESRYVCLARLVKMLDHEYSLLIERLAQKRGKDTRFFAFADTVATFSHSDDTAKRSHGWMGVRFQAQPGAEFNDIVIHVRLWDRYRLQQQEALGILGVNLIHAAFFHMQNPEQIIHALVDNLTTQRIEVDMIQFTGPLFAKVDHRQLALTLVEKELTDAIMLSPDGKVLHAPDILFRKPVLIQRGTFRPVSNINLQILERGLTQFRKEPLVNGQEPVVLMEITTQRPEINEGYDRQDVLDRAETLSATGHMVLISRYFLFYQLKQYLRESTSELLAMVMGAAHLEKMLDPQYYAHLPGKTLESFGRLLDEKTKIYVFPYKQKEFCLTTKSFNPTPELSFLYRYFLANNYFVDIVGCDDIDTSILSKDVRDMLVRGDPRWESLVPKTARDIIYKKKLFGLKSSQ